MDLVSEIADIKQEIASIKTQQDTGGDSALLYRQIYNPGILWRGDDYLLAGRKHTIRCITDVELGNCFFIPILQGGLGIQTSLPDAMSLNDFSDTITWYQNVSIYVGDEAGLIGPNGITIYSNVPFVIETSYQDLRYSMI